MGKPIIINSTPGTGKKIARVDAMSKSVQAHLNGIADWFDEPRITLVVRTEKGGDLIMTSDTADAAIAALQAEVARAKAN
jgi:hypothetical protein